MFLEEVEVTVAVKRKSFANNQKSDEQNDDVVRIQEALNKLMSEKNAKPGNTHEHKYPLNLKIEKEKIEEVNDGDVGLANYENPKWTKRDNSLPGEMGKGYTVAKEDKDKEKLGYQRHAFNQLVSDRISIYRSLKDYRNNQ